MNPKTRTATVEVLMNDAELQTMDAIRGGLGRSPFLRSLMHAAATVARTHVTAHVSTKESRRCRGPGKPASRGGAVMTSRRHL